MDHRFKSGFLMFIAQNYFGSKNRNFGSKKSKFLGLKIEVFGLKIEIFGLKIEISCKYFFELFLCFIRDGNKFSNSFDLNRYHPNDQKIFVKRNSNTKSTQKNKRK